MMLDKQPINGCKSMLFETCGQISSKTNALLMPGFVFTFVAVLSLAGLSLAQEPTHPPGQTSPVNPLSYWVSRLGSATFADREKSTSRLIEAGAAAIQPTLEAAESDDREIAWRSVYILQKIAGNAEIGDPPEAMQALENLANSSNVFVAARAKLRVAELAALRRQIATERLRTLGAEVSVRNEQVASVRFTEKFQGTAADLIHLRWTPQVDTLYFKGSQLSDAALEHLAKLPHLERLYFGGCPVKGPGLAHLAGSTQLRFISLKGCEVNAEAFKHLAKLTSLEKLGLDDTPTNDAGLAHLKSLKLLQTIWLNDTQITDAGLVHLANLPMLNKIILTRTAIAGPGLRSLAKLQNLRYLSFQGVKLTDTDAEAIGQLRQVETLGLDGTQVGDKTLQQLRSAPNLEVLWLTDANVTDQGLPHLITLPKLRRVYLKGTDVTDEAVRRFSEKAPQCQVMR